ncbi:polysaccharide deacetylase family protein [Bdellovibrio sp. SKB1291214]|uniref:polysaccharide deacetylase family protein n=1 Tax=Bdellovibrio sp. SKB1291214 TaxID=1732569 RepID=UPI000B51ADBE|nr:polysaccharide deacetylase family protein [Bdellovibrio sp. SKB1291214]UYL10020.1 polysaccharide deacetylase family protein [Bdellovibrio sp. SKB1291214]
MKRSLVFVFSVGMMSLTACGNNGFETVKADLVDAVTANETVPTVDDWHASQSNPEKLFPKWKEMIANKQLTGAEVCESLKALKDEDLALMEEQLDEASNAEMLKDCKEELALRIDNYFLNDRANMPSNLGNFFEDEIAKAEPVQHAQSAKMLTSVSGSSAKVFPNNIQYRDTSNGYYAVNADVAPGEVVLTFDDGPSEKYTEIILKTLKKMNAKAMFFALGKQVIANPAVVKMVAADGHSLGGHSMSHRCLAAKTICKNNNGGKMLSLSEATKEISGSLNAIRNTIGWVDPFFRFPYGEYDKSLTSYLNANGIGNFYWRIDSNDWRKQTSSTLVEKTMSQIKAAGKGVILFHDIQQRTAEALPEILNQLYNGGYKIVLIKPKNVMTVPVNPAP